MGILSELFIYFLANTPGPLWYHFEALFNQTPLGEIINRNLMSNDTYYDSLLEFLMDFIQMSINTSTQLQFNVSLIFRIDREFRDLPVLPRIPALSGSSKLSGILLGNLISYFY